MPSPSPSTARERTAERSRVRRKPERASYDFADAAAIVDEALYCHVGIVRDGAPVVIPMVHARDGRRLYLHASPAAGLARDARRGESVCVTFTLVDALVLARCGRSHSLNYRSAVVFGEARRVTDEAEKRRALEAFVEHATPGRWEHLRPMTDQEVREVDVVALDLDELSVKVRTGPPVDSETDRALPIWAGLLPVGLVATGPPETAGEVAPDVPIPDHVSAWGAARAGGQAAGFVARPS
jgi:nitroimidazol reductase NimA-like FMN-containing flavoprotein (pyridoxamine 5'-phosphate oxidase superfamily)